MLTHVAGLVENDVPLLNEILGNNVEAFTEVISNESHYHQRLKEAKRREDPVGYLTEVFVKELHQLVTTPTSNKVNITNRWWRVKRFIAKFTQHLPWVQQDNIRYPRVILFLDTVEQLAPEAASWLLDHFLKADMSSN